MGPFSVESSFRKDEIKRLEEKGIIHFLLSLLHKDLEGKKKFEPKRQLDSLHFKSN